MSPYRGCTFHTLEHLLLGPQAQLQYKELKKKYNELKEVAKQKIEFERRKRGEAEARALRAEAAVTGAMDQAEASARVGQPPALVVPAIYTGNLN